MFKVFKKKKKKKNAENINPRVSKPSNGKTMVLPKCAICGSTKSRFIKKQEASETLSSLGFKTPLSKILLFGDILLWILLNIITLNDFADHQKLF